MKITLHYQIKGGFGGWNYANAVY